MDICLQTVISYLFLFVAFTIELGAGQKGCDDQLWCGGHGPAIRFPFRHSSQSKRCGYPGFNLSCTTDTNQTVLELPISVKLHVKKIDYKSQTIQLYDPDHCFPRQLEGLNLSSSPFQFKHPALLDYGLFNCSPRKIDYNLISCFSGPTYQVYSTFFMMPSFISCTKMFTLSVPNSIVDHPHKILELKWSTPACRHCEVKGKRCMKSDSSGSRTHCVSKHAKGIQSISMQLSIQLFVL
jgi:hypothetical protein